mmetsp:Transcript_13615/g.28893  ORF Transcript_13615/g.28893 Transcript_13615/m.28893 type:complete len:433 (+) Transcript_13615:193-1491(+)
MFCAYTQHPKFSNMSTPTQAAPLKAGLGMNEEDIDERRPSIAPTIDSDSGSDVSCVGVEVDNDLFEVDIMEEQAVSQSAQLPTKDGMSCDQPRSSSDEGQTHRWNFGRHFLWSRPQLPAKDGMSSDKPTPASDERGTRRRNSGINFIWSKPQSAAHTHFSKSSKNEKDTISRVQSCPAFKTETSDNNDKETSMKRSPSLLQNIIDDFTPHKGDQKILRAIGRTATVNVAVLVTAATGGAAGAIGYATGGAITAKRLHDGLQAEDEKEVTKSLAVYGCATGASIAGQAAAGALMIGLAGASLPLAGAVAFGVGCVSGISAGALSEWTVDSVMDAGGCTREKRPRDESIDEMTAVETDEEEPIDETTPVETDKEKSIDEATPVESNQEESIDGTTAVEAYQEVSTDDTPVETDKEESIDDTPLDTDLCVMQTDE